MTDLEMGKIMNLIQFKYYMSILFESYVQMSPPPSVDKSPWGFCLQCGHGVKGLRRIRANHLYSVKNQKQHSTG